MKNLSRNPYLKQIKNGRLKFPIRLYLYHCGRRDARKKIVRKDDNGYYFSPFICQQIYLYNLALQIEEESFINSVLPIEAEREIFQLQIDQKEQMEEGINQDMKLSVNEKLNFEQAITILKTKNLLESQKFS